MEGDEDMFVVIVGETTDEEQYSELQTKIIKSLKGEAEAIGLKELIETAEKHGEVKFNLKKDPFENPIEKLLEDSTSEAAAIDLELIETVEKLGEGLPVELDIKEEPFEYVEEELLEDSPSEDIVDHNISEIPQQRRRTMVKPNQRRSFISELREKFEELNDDMDLLTDTLCEIMRSVKPPPPPQDYFIMNDIMFECTTCGAMRDSMPAAARHYQEIHGPRYLTCYACGVDFRSTTTLYKHEKRCRAPDAPVMLKARALFLGRKGRTRPYLTDNQFMCKYLELQNKTHSCRLCPAVFAIKSSLQSHMHLHNGVRPYRCGQCPVAYTSQSALTKHKKKHLDVQYICDHCKRSFKVKQALVAHMDTHRPQRKYPCELCDRRFAQKMALKLHIDGTHLNLPPPCACHVCPKRYPKMSVLKNHMQKAHGMTLITRNMFFKKLPTLTETELNEAKNIKADLATINDLIISESDNFKDHYNVEDDYDIDLELKRLLTNNELEEDKDVKLVVIQNGEIVSSDDVQVKEELFLNDQDMMQETDLMDDFNFDGNSEYVINNLNADTTDNVKNKRKKNRRKSQDIIQYLSIEPMNDSVIVGAAAAAGR